MGTQEVIKLALQQALTTDLEKLAYEADGNGSRFTLFVNELAKRSDYVIA